MLSTVLKAFVDSWATFEIVDKAPFEEQRLIRHAHCHGTEERLRPEPVVDLANLWQENSIDYTLKVHVYIENLTFFQLDIKY